VNANKINLLGKVRHKQTPPHRRARGLRGGSVCRLRSGHSGLRRRSERQPVNAGVCRAGESAINDEQTRKGKTDN
jgi:hypothetical protein